MKGGIEDGGLDEEGGKEKRGRGRTVFAFWNAPGRV